MSDDLADDFTCPECGEDTRWAHADWCPTGLINQAEEEDDEEDE